MRLIGMMDSPYVRRVAVSMNAMGLKYDHEPVSVFRHFDAFAAINPVVKAPTFVTDEGIMLVDSTLILAHLDRIVAPERQLSPTTIEAHARAQRVVGLALAACEKTMQLVYETKLRPEEKQHDWWRERVLSQLAAAYRLLEAEIGSGETWLFGDRPLQADISSAVAWRFTNGELPGVVAAEAHPKLARLAERAEALPEFVKAPYE
ncbi:glutathione S-transferase [Starkeya sp. ORNL1]|uniref:glutathione S-transferase family protein n=1 Tax=Starkeya sp. ORNL1 TaxID=2709380 RepID=UPI0014635FD0|nr:glutathione S-transferase [Starkeya sp. ORNL1]QJP13188.1 glutathione S-transferase [Starkeya sp. ORNL1]